MKQIYYYVFMTICCAITTSHQSFAEEYQQSNSKEIRISDSDKKNILGLCSNNPIIIKGVRSDFKLFEKQKQYINNQDGNYRILSDSLTMDAKGRIIQMFFLEDDEGHSKEIYFDITDTCKKFKKFKNENFKDRVEKLLKDGPQKPAKVKISPEDIERIKLLMPEGKLKKDLLSMPQSTNQSSK